MTYVDERVVELRFDNKQFEQETAKSMSTLDKLKEKLNFKNASSGAEQLQKAVANINVNPVLQGIGAIETKMSTLGIAGKRIIENLTDWAMSGVNKVISKLNGPINQIITGGKSRAQNIEQAKFQLEGLGVAWADIEEDISYGVQDTAYGLDAAAKVASQLVASQVQLGDEMKHALLGISGVAAMTNSSYDDIGRIYTTVAGNGRLMGEQLLQLSSRGINAAAQLAKAFNTTEAEVRDMVSKGKISFDMFSEAMFEAFGEHAKSANKTFQGALSNTKAALSRLGADVAAQGFNSIRDILNEIIPKLKEFKKGVKPLEDAIIKMVDAVGKLVQAFVKAVDIQKIIDTLVPKMEKFVNVCTEWVTAYRQVFTGQDRAIRGNTAFIEEQKALGKITQSTKEATEATLELSNITAEQKEMAREIWEEGKYGTGDARREALGKDYEMVQAYIDEMIALGWDQEAMEKKLTKAAEEEQQAVENLAKTERKRQVIVKITAALSNLKTVAKNVFTSVKNVLTVAFDSMRDVFFKGGSNSVGNGIVSFTGSLARFSEKIKITEEKAQKLKPIFTALFTVFKAIGKVVGTLIKGLAKVVSILATLINKVAQSQIIKKIFDAIGTAVGKVVEAIEKIYTKLKETGVWDKFVGVLKIVAEWLGERLVDAFNFVGAVASAIGEGAIDIFGAIGDKIKSIWDNAKEAFPWLQKIVDFFKEDVLSGSWLTKLKELITDIFGSGKDVFAHAFDMGSSFINGLVSGLKDLSLEDVEKISKIFGVLATTIAGFRWLSSMAKMNSSLADMTGSLTAIFETLNTTIKKYGKRADAERFKVFADGVVKVVGSLISLMIVFAVLQGFDFDAGYILDKCAQIVLVISAIAGIAQVLTAWFSKGSNNNQTFNIGSKLKVPTFALTLFAIAYLMQTMIDGVMTIYNFTRQRNFDSGKMWGIIITLGILFAGISTLTILAIKFSKATSGMSGLALTLIAIGVLINLIVKSFKKVLDIVKSFDFVDITIATGIIEAFLWPILIFAAGVVALNGALPQKGLVTNPFKGMFGMFISLAALIRLALVPLLNALVKANKEGDAGVDAIGDFQDILKSIELFVFGLSAISLILSRTISAGGFSTTSKTGPILGAAAMVAALAFVFSQLSKVFASVKDVDSHTLARVKDIITSIEWFIGIMAVLVSVGSALAGPAVIGGLLSLAAVIASVGYMMYSAGIGFKTFQEGLVNLVTSLPEMRDKLLDFFRSISSDSGGGHHRGSVRNELIKGIEDTASLFFEGITAAVVGWSKAMVYQVPTIITNLFTALIVALNATADAFINQGPDVVKAADRCAIGGLYFLSLVVDKIQERGRGLFRAALTKVFEMDFSDFWNATLGKLGADWDPFSGGIKYEGPLNDMTMDEYRKKLKEDAAKNADMQADTYIKSFYDELETKTQTYGPESFYKTSAAQNIDVNGLMSYMGLNTDKIPKDVRDVIGGKIQTGLAQITSGSYFNMPNMKDFTVESLFGDYTDTSWYTEMWSEMQAKGIEGGEDLTDIMEKYTSDSWNILNMNTDDYTEVGERQFNNVGEGIRSKEEFIQAASKSVSDKALEEMYSKTPRFLEIGNLYGSGIAIGMTDGNVAYKMKKATDKLGLWAIGGTEETLDEQSPSHEAMRIGSYFTQGFINGILSLENAVGVATEDIGEESMSALQMILNRLFDTSMENMDVNPTITPVLDLSQVESGITSMNGMFDNNSSYGLAFGNATAYNNGLSAKFAGMKVQNEYDGTNVVEAVNGLRNDISDIKGTLSTLGFYVDGKQMATAIADPMNSALNKIAVNTGRGVK